MKKFFPALLAMVVAISMSAFTTIETLNKKSGQAILHWFEYDDDTETVGSFINTGEREEMTIGTCEGNAGPDCRRGYTTLQLNGGLPANGVNPSFKDANPEQIQRN